MKHCTDTPHKHTMWRGMRWISRYIPRLFTTITLHTIITAAWPYLSVWFFCEILIAAHGPSDILWTWIAAALATETVCLLTAGALKRIKEAKWERLYPMIDRLLTDKLLSLDHADVDDHDTQELLTRVKEQMNALGAGLVRIPEVFQLLLSGIVGLISAVGLIGSLFIHPVPDSVVDHTVWNSSIIAAVAALTLFGVTAAAFRIDRAAQRTNDRQTDNVVMLDRLYYTLTDAVMEPSKAADIRLYRQDALIAQYLDDTDAAFFRKQGLKRQQVYGKVGVLRTIAACLPTAWVGAATLFIAVKARLGAFGVGPAVRYIGAAALMARDAGTLRLGIEQYQKNVPYLKTVFRFLDTQPRMYRGSLTTEKRADRDFELAFRRVSFSYPAADRVALSDVSVTLRPGSRIAVVGENGSGKSTFVKLLTRLYDPQNGEILLNGIDIRKYRYDEYIGLVSVVFQDHRLLSQSIGGNVAGHSDYDVARVRHCLNDVGFTQPIDLDTPLGHRFDPHGIVLSSGDIQKIAIARALYKDAPIIILDEPTAALDPVTEAEIYAHLDHIIEDRTAVFVSHRLSSCRFCDEILVFDNGTIIQRGTHAELLSQSNGKYYALWHAQAQYYQ